MVGSATVGPEATTAGSSPGTSEITSVNSRAGQAAAARRPPLTAERCFLTQFISAIEAPLFSSARFICCFSASVMPSNGNASRDDPPPEISASTRSSEVSSRTTASMRAAAIWPASFGTGCAASITSIRLQGTPWP